MGPKKSPKSSASKKEQPILKNSKEARAWKLPAASTDYYGSWVKVRQVEMKNLIIGFVCMIYSNN